MSGRCLRARNNIIVSNIVEPIKINYQNYGTQFSIHESETLLKLLEKYRKIEIKGNSKSQKLLTFTKETWEKITEEYNIREFPRTLIQLRTKYFTLKKKIKKEINVLKKSGISDPCNEIKIQNPFLYRVMLLSNDFKQNCNRRKRNHNMSYDTDNTDVNFVSLNEDNIEILDLKVEKIEDSFCEDNTEDPIDTTTPNERMVINPTIVDASQQAVNQSRKDLAELQIFLMEQDFNTKEKRESEYHNERMKLIGLEQEKINLEIYLTKIQIDKLTAKEQ